MKKKLLVLLLIVTLMFSALAFTACDPDDGEWNYFSTVYDGLKGEKDIRFQTMVYLQLQEMYLTTGGRFLVWFGSHTDAGSQASAKIINDLAIDFNVSVIYNFDPILDGGWATEAGLKSSVPTGGGGVYDYITDLRNTNIGNLSEGLGFLQDELKLVFKEVPMNKLVYFTGAALGPEQVEDKDGNLIDNPEAGKITDEFKNGIVKSTGTTKEHFEDVVLKSCIRVPNAGRFEEKKDQYFSIVTPFDYFSDQRFRIVAPDGDGNSQFLTPSNSVFQNVTYHEFMTMLDPDEGIKGDFLVHFGGAWCPNTQAMAWMCDRWAKDYSLDRIYLFDPFLDGKATGLESKKALSNGTGGIRSDDAANAKGFAYTGLYAELLNALGGTFISDWNQEGLTTDFTIDYFGIEDYPDLATVTVGSGTQRYLTRMCVPNIMLLNNATIGTRKAPSTSKIIAFVECEYTYSQTSNPNNPIAVKLNGDLDAFFEKHSEAYWNPIIEVADEDGEESAGGGAPADGDD